MKVLLFILMLQNSNFAKWEHQGSFDTPAACETAVRKMKQTAPHWRFEYVCTDK